MSYYPWVDDDGDESFARLDSSRKVELEEKEYLLDEGVPCKDWFPKNLIFDLDKDSGTRLADSIPNAFSMRFVSKKLKGILEKQAPENPIEFLPVRLRTPRKKVLEAPYFIANVLGTVSCMNVKKSDFVQDTILKDQVMYFRRLTLDEKKIPQAAKIFRLAEKYSLILVREDLGQDILDEDCTGMSFVDLEDFGSEFRRRRRA